MMQEKLARYGQWTYRGAWVIEIVAAILGLTTGIALGWQGYTADESGDAFGFILASTPFFMVALAELTKIPIATLLFAAPYIYKPFLLVFLAGLAFITFETVFTGLERAAALRQLQYDKLYTGLRQRQQELARLDREISDLVVNNAIVEAQKQYDTLFKQRQNEIEGIRNEIVQLDRNQALPPLLRDEIERTRQRLAEKQEELDAIYKRRDSEIDREREAFERQRNSFLERIDEANKRGDEVYAKSQREELARLRNPVPVIQQQYEPQIDSRQKEIDDLNRGLDNLNARIPSSEDPAIRQRRNDLNKRLEVTMDRWQERLDDANMRLADAQAVEANKNVTVLNRQERVSQINSEINNLEQERIPLARTDQVRRIAARFYGVNPEEVDAKQADTVAIIWFGSLAALAALTGPLTAMVALGLQSLADRSMVQDKVRRKESKLSRSLRNVLLNWRFRRTKTKHVEVPVEKPTKEIFYVPILTDDPDAIKQALALELPVEVSELVKVKLARPKPDANGSDNIAGSQRDGEKPSRRRRSGQA